MSHAIFAALAGSRAGSVDLDARDTIRRSGMGRDPAAIRPARAGHALPRARARIPTSTCALVALRYLARVRVPMPAKHQRPYLRAWAPSRLRTSGALRDRHNAWLTAPTGLRPTQPDGDVLCRVDQRPIPACWS